MYGINDIEKITNFKSWSDNQKKDELLRIDASIHAQLGIDSTKGERNEVRKQSRTIYKAIKEIDKPLGDEFLNLMD